MATPNISFNPVLSTNFPGSFSVQSNGYVQGVFLDDPAVRYALRGGILATSETVPMWGGVVIDVAVPTPATASSALGGVITRAAGYPTALGFSVFNQASNMVQTPQSRVPLSGTSMGVNYFLFGSGARIAVACSAALAAALEGGAYNQQVSWDFVNQVLIAFSATALPVKVINVNVGNSKIVTYSSVTNYANWTNNGSCALIEI
ncbi:MAG: hypothetical protein ACRESI_06525 [Gammaproteobacteria bacterium]